MQINATHPNFLNRLSIQHLQYLLVLVEERHVTRAAERVGVGQPAMSTVLSRMREVFKDELLVKTSSGLEVTSRAIEIARTIRNLIDMCDARGLQASRFDPAQTQMHWRIMASDGVARTLLPGAMASLSKQSPHMCFSVQPGDPRRLSEYLCNSDFDLCLTFARSPGGTLRQSILYSQQLVCIARVGHPKVQDAIDLPKFTHLAHVRWGGHPLAQATMEAVVDEALQHQGLARKVTLTVPALSLLPEIVAGTDLLAVVSGQVARDAAQYLPLQILPLPVDVPSVDVSMVWHERRQHDPAHQWLRDVLRTASKQAGKRQLQKQSTFPE